MMLDTAFLLLAGFFIGLTLGSFAGMASWRWPQGFGWRGRSRCTGCYRPLRVKELVPVFSWLWQKGLCGCQNNKLSVRYPLIELATALPIMYIFVRYGLSIETIILTAFVTLLVIITFIDWEHMMIPDGAQITLALLGLCWIYQTGAPWMERLITGFVLGGLGAFLAGPYSRWRGRDMLGWGDVKFLAAAGLWFGAPMAPVFLALAGIAGVAFGVFMGRNREFPFAPCLCLSLLIIVLFPLTQTLDAAATLAYNLLS